MSWNDLRGGDETGPICCGHFVTNSFTAQSCSRREVLAGPWLTFRARLSTLRPPHASRITRGQICLRQFHSSVVFYY